MNQHHIYMRRCIQLGLNGLGTTYPNPLVGSVIVYKDQIIGEGWHYKAGQPHAEVHAINSVKDESLLSKSTIYVSLEPCSHYGKTPPCSDLIIAKGIKQIVIGAVDPFAKVSGTGIQKLMSAGCDVTIGILETECQQLNKRFFTFHKQKRPYIILKWAETDDGYIAPQEMLKRTPVWITNSRSRQLVHNWRAEEEAILVGHRTVSKDNPKLNIRNWQGTNPVRVIIDLYNKIPENSAVLDQMAKTIIITADTSNKKQSDQIIYENIVAGEDTITQICKILYKHQIQSVIIEGGAATLQSFIDMNIWDEARVFRSSQTFGSGVKAPVLLAKIVSKEYIVQDSLTIYTHD